MSIPENQIRSIAYWLFFCCFMVFSMAVIGAITRLTESGLSMVEWRPLIGTLPPMSETEWQRVFDLYQQTPEYQQKNSWMGMADFKHIFFWEWLHRFWGRMIGIVYVLPLVFFWVKGWIPQDFKSKLFIGLILGTLQGGMGWYMVMSGLVDRPSVSHYRLAVHLSLAFVIFGYLYWLALGLLHRARPFNLEIAHKFCVLRHGVTALLFLSLTIIWGAFVAGLDAGMVYNSWPMMGKHFLPPDAFNLTPFGLNFFENPVAVQWVHRWIAVITGLLIFTFGLRLKDFAIMAMTLIQIGVGIATLLTQVHIHSAATHQAGAFILLALMLLALFRIVTRRRMTGEA